MESLKKVIVTGCNKGVGFGIIRNLYQKPYKIIMACRSLELAKKSKEDLEKEFPHAKGQLFLQELDVSNFKSIDSFLKNISQEFGTVDILLNNAGMAFKGDLFNDQVVTETLQTNFFGAVELTEKILPLISTNGKIIHVTSSAGKTKYLKSEILKSQFLKEKLTKSQIFDLANGFIQSVKDNTFEEKGWPKWGYAISKLLLNVYVRNLEFNYSELIKKNKIQVYSCCPGYVKTDMSSYKGELSIDEGALTPVYLVELPFEVKEELQGQFFSKEKVGSISE